MLRLLAGLSAREYKAIVTYMELAELSITDAGRLRRMQALNGMRERALAFLEKGVRPDRFLYEWLESIGVIYEGGDGYYMACDLLEARERVLDAYYLGVVAVRVGAAWPGEETLSRSIFVPPAVPSVTPPQTTPPPPRFEFPEEKIFSGGEENRGSSAGGWEPELNDELLEGLLDEDMELIEQAKAVCLREKRGSVTLLQAKLGWGYGKAKRIYEKLIESGFLGEDLGQNKGRAVNEL